MKTDPVLDSEEFTKALTHVALEDISAYRCIKRLLFDGLTFNSIAIDLKMDKGTVQRRCKKATELLRDYLQVHRPQILQDLIRDTVEELTREEAETVNQRFPFVNTSKIPS